MEEMFLKAIGNGSATAILGFAVGFMLLKTIPGLQSTFRKSLDKLIKQQAKRDRLLISWLADKSGFPMPLPDEADDEDDEEDAV